MAEKKVNLNKASLEELETLRMVGDTRAQFVIDHRPYKDWDDLKSKVPGLSDQMVNDMKNSGATL